MFDSFRKQNPLGVPLGLNVLGEYHGFVNRIADLAVRNSTGHWYGGFVPYPDSTLAQGEDKSFVFRIRTFGGWDFVTPLFVILWY